KTIKSGTTTMIYLISQLLPIISVICGAILAYHNINGWGWFVFIALMFGGVDIVQKHRSGKEKNEE
ncbi:MAG: hypothetical protein RR610_18690, partial [Citrobacter sp.]